MKNLRNVSWIVAIAITFILLSACSRSCPSAKDCHQVNAKGSGQTISQTATGATTVATITGDPLINGTTKAEFTNLPSTDPSEAPFQGKLELSTTDGTLTLRLFNGKLNPLNGKFSSDSDVLNGTGKFKNASGSLFFSGAINTANGSFTEDITGSLCLDKLVQSGGK